jgi:hypothetical protein
MDSIYNDGEQLGENQVEENSCWVPECQADQIGASANWLCSCSAPWGLIGSHIDFNKCIFRAMDGAEYAHLLLRDAVMLGAKGEFNKAEDTTTRGIHELKERSTK